MYFQILKSLLSHYLKILGEQINLKEDNYNEFKNFKKWDKEKVFIIENAIIAFLNRNGG